MHGLVKDLTGQTYGSLTVLYRAPARGQYRTMWHVRCTCGAEKNVRGTHLRARKSTSCGSCARQTHGLSKTHAYHLWENAKPRARRKGLPFTITPADIVVPTHCPLLGKPLVLQGKSQWNATLDQIRPGQGYTPDNVWVISWRANAIKSDLTLAQLELFVAGVRDAHKARGA